MEVWWRIHVDSKFRVMGRLTKKKKRFTYHSNSTLKLLLFNIFVYLHGDILLSLDILD